MDIIKSKDFFYCVLGVALFVAIPFGINLVLINLACTI